MAKSNISEFNCISIHELPTWIKVFKAEDPVPKPIEMLQELTLIDDLLTIMKTQSLMRKKRGMKDQLERRIDYDLGFAKPGR